MSEEQVDEPQASADAPGEGVPAGGGAPALSGEELEDAQADAAEDFLNGLLDVLDMDGEAEADIEDGAIVVDMEGPDMAVLIGRHGATLDALQELTRATVQHQTSSRVRLTLDIGGYRERQRSILERKVVGLAAKVRDEGRAISLEPMSAYDRRVVHSVLAEFAGVATASEGEDPERYVVIKPA